MSGLITDVIFIYFGTPIKLCSIGVNV